MAAVKSVTRLSVGLFGFLFHLAAAGLLAAKAARSPAADLRSIVGPTIAVAVAAFVIYAIIITPYAKKRFGTAKRGIVFFDFLIGMLAEIAVIALAALLHAIPAASGAFAAGGVAGYLANVLSTTALAFLWAVGTAMTEVLAVGNGAGFVGYIVLKKLAAREQRASAPEAHPPDPAPQRRG
jgi:hypothetical protein